MPVNGTVDQNMVSFAANKYINQNVVPLKPLFFQLEAENREFGDLVQGNFVDAYRLVARWLLATRWFVFSPPGT